MKLLILAFLFFSFHLQAKVEPQNYNFSLDALSLFHPGKEFKAIEAKYGKGEEYGKVGQIKIYKFYVAQIRYKFPVLVQVFEGKVLDFFARLPSYFSHDLYHQSLINRYGKQDLYKKSENSAVYIWNNKGGFRHIYSGTCTITCFPMYYSGIPVDTQGLPGNFKPLIKQQIGSLEVAF
jgi:hypothetical protein